MSRDFHKAMDVTVDKLEQFVLKSELRTALESQRTKGTAVRGLRLYSIIISKYYTPAVRGLRLREKVRPTAANFNLTKL